MAMTRGIQLKQLSAVDLGHLGIPAALLAGADDDLAADDGAGVPSPLAITREVRVCLEETLALLIEALPARLR